MNAVPDHSRVPAPGVDLLVLVQRDGDEIRYRRALCQTLTAGLAPLIVDRRPVGSPPGGANDGRQLRVACRSRGRGAVFWAAAAAARQVGATHLLSTGNGDCPRPDDLRALAAAAEQQPDTLFLGSRRRFGRGVNAGWGGGCLGRLLFRLQTGIKLRDPASRMRVYPLYILDFLKLGQKGDSFEMAALLKAAWGGVPLREVPVSVPFRPGVPGRSLLERLWHLMLAVHFTFRSITPLPHPRVPQDEQRKDEEPITIFHPLRSIRRLLRQDVSPRRLALAGALGVYLGALPLVACHTIAILFAAGFLRLNKLAALSASQLCMPPLVPALCIEAGYFLRHGRFLTEISLNTLGYQALERLWEWLLGALVLAPLLAAVAGGVIYMMVWWVTRGTGQFIRD